jgi:hypothetical protein
MKHPVVARRWLECGRSLRQCSGARAESTLLVLALLGTLAVLAAIFWDFFPGPNGLGNDYSYSFPDLLSNYYWALANGPWMPPWFTPAFCGGQPAFADPQSSYYSLPQLLVTFFDPVTSVFWTLLILAAWGFLGSYLFLRQSMAVSKPAALMAAVMFALNGFFSHRMLVGHLVFHAIMLLPLLAWALTANASELRLRSPQTWRGVAVGALIVAYGVHSGMLGLALPALVSLFALLCLFGLRGNSLAAALLRCAWSVAGGAALGAAKVVGALAYMHQFPRAAYALGGFSSTWDSLQFAWTALFFGPAHITATSANALVNYRHEFEFSLTPVAGFLLIWGGLLCAARWWRSAPRSRCPNGRTLGLVLALLGLMAIPVLLNTAYGPHWHALLKSIPVIKSSSTLVRWFVVYIPVVCVLAALCLDRITSHPGLRAGSALLAVSATVFFHFQADLRYYSAQRYDPKPIQQAFEKARNTGVPPAIQYVAVVVDASGKAVLAFSRNDLLIHGYSSLLCYNPMFGYQLEALPVGALHPGPALEVRKGEFNLKNPACYLYPEENACAPGAHFTQQQEAQAKRFLQYRSISFRISWLQRVANGLSVAMFLGLLAYGAWSLWRWWGLLRGA